MLVAELSLDTAILCAAVVWLLFALTFAALGRAGPQQRAVWFWAGAYGMGAVRHLLSLSDVQAHYLSETAAIFALAGTTLHAAGAAATAGRRVSIPLFVIAPIGVGALFLLGRLFDAPRPLTGIPMALLVGGYLLAALWWFGVKARSEAFPACFAVAVAYGLWGALAVGFPVSARYAPEMLPAATIVNMLLGALTGILLIIISLFEAERRARALADEAERAKLRLERVIDATSDWIWETDAQHRFTFMSPRVEEATKARISDLIGKRRDLLAPNHPESPLWDDYRALVDARRPFRDFRYPAVSGDQRRVTLSVSGSPLFDPKGTFLGYRGTGRDVTAEAVIRSVREAFSGSVANLVGEAFFRTLVTQLADTLGADLAFVARVQDDGLEAQTVAVYRDGAIVENFSYALMGSPCEGVIEGRPTIYSTGVQSLFPEDVGLQRLGIDAYAGIGLMGAGGRALGILVLASRSRYRDDATILSALDLIAPRAAAELDRDISLQALKEGEARLRSILDNMPLEFTARDREGRFILTNQGYADMIGVPPEEIIGETPDTLAQKLSLSDFFAGWRENDQRVMNEGKAWTFEADYLEPRNRTRVSPRLMSKFPIHDSKRQIVAVGTLAIDITERRRLEAERDRREAAIRQSEATLRSVMNGMPYDFSARDREGRFIFVGDTYADRLGLPVEEILGSTPDEIAAKVGMPDLFRGWRENDARVLNEGRPWSFEADYPMTTNGGRVDPYLISKFPIRDADGSIVAAATLGIDITERRRLERERDAREAALRESEARFRAVVDNLPIGFQLKGRDQRYIMVNQALAALVGRSAEEMQGKTAEELSLVIGDSRLFAGASMDDKEVLETRKTISREVEEPDPRDPNRRIFLARVKFPLFDDSGRLVAIGTLVTDVTERRRLEVERASREASIRESEARFRAVIDNMPIGLSIKTLDGRFVAVNGAHQSMMSIPASESLGATAPQIAAGRGMAGLYDRFVTADQSVLQNRRAEAFEVVLPHPEGPEGKRFYLISKFPIPDEAGNAVSIGTMITDITGQKLLTEKIVAREAELRRVLAALDMMREGITVEDVGRQVLYANHAARDLIGPDRGTLMFLESQDQGSVLLREGHWSGEVTTRHPQRGEVEVRVDSVSLADGTVVSILEDVTEDRTRRRETEVLARRLQHAEKMEALGRFAGGIAHDFNNLLGAIVGFAGFIAEDAGPEDNNRIYAERILAAGNRAKNVIQEILGFSRTDEPVKEPVAIAELVRETVDIVHSTLPGTTNIELSTPDEPMVVAANADQMTRVLMNLLINASDALEGATGTIRVTVGTTEVGDGADMEPARASPGLDVVERPQGGWRSVAGRVLPGNYVTIDVADHGQGMTRDVLEKIYDPFFTTKGRGKGTGLGLPLVHGIILAHGGGIIVETMPGSGSLFRILLPTAMPLVRRARTPSPVATPPGQGRILIVDDDQDFGDMVQTALDRAGYETAVINDPLEALEILREDPAIWDLVVTDLNMPGMSGTELIGEIRRLRTDLPCVLCTGFGLDIDERQALDLGASIFRRKPVDVATLVSDVGRLVSQKRGS